jgi:hypothetical protein
MTKLQRDIVEKMLNIEQNRFCWSIKDEDLYFMVREHKVYNRLYVCVWMEGTNLCAGKFVPPKYMISDIYNWDISDPDCDFKKISDEILVLCRNSPLEWKEEK